MRCLLLHSTPFHMALSFFFFLSFYIYICVFIYIISLFIAANFLNHAIVTTLKIDNDGKRGRRWRSRSTSGAAWQRELATHFVEQTPEATVEATVEAK